MQLTPAIPHDGSDALKSILDEMAAQDIKWGADRNHDLVLWHLILSEEVGEFAEAILHYQFGGPKETGLRNEIVQVAAVALQIIEYIDRNELMETIDEQ